VGTFGERLRREREMRGINLDEIATATKISTRNLRALEEEKFNQLPGGVFNRGFVRAYAKFLGIDEEHIIAEYEAASHETEAARDEKLKVELAKVEERPRNDQEISLEPKSQWGTIAAIVLIAVLGYGGYNVYQKKKHEREHPAQSSQSALVPPSTTEQPLSSNPSSTEATVPPNTSDAAIATNPDQTRPGESATPSAATAASQKSTADPAKLDESKTSAPGINLKLRVLQESWISIKADGRLLVSETLPAGMEKTYKARDKVEVVLGKAGGVELTYNGKPVENLSQAQDVRKITFTPSGYE
jgi:cytoskeleton protein RodZ